MSAMATYHETLDNELANGRHLGVDHCDERRVDGREDDRRRLCAHAGARKEAAAADQVLRKQLRYQVLDVGRVDLATQHAQWMAKGRLSARFAGHTVGQPNRALLC